MKDGFGREITYARISLTDKCNLRCRYCMPEEGVPPKSHKELLSFEEMEKVLDALIALNVSKVRLTGGEPLVRKGAMNFIKTASKKDIDLYLTTNGTLLSRYAQELLAANIKGINISLDTLNAAKYADITRREESDFFSVLEGIERIARLGFTDIKLNAVLLKGINDNEIEDFIEFAMRHNLKLRFIELMPFLAQEKYAESKYLAAQSIIDRHPKWEYIGEKDNSVANYYRTPSGAEVGFIKPLSDKFCSRCNRIRITADGHLLNCLHEEKGFSLKPYLDSGLKDFIAQCVLEKPLCHQLSKEGATQSLNMNEIGG